MSKSRNPLRKTRRTLRLLALLTPGSKWRLVAFAVASALAGFLEAGVLVLVSQVAVAISTGSQSVVWRVGFTPQTTMAISTVFGIAVALTFVRAATRSFAAWISSRVAADSLQSMRNDLTNAFLGASWDRQARESEGHVQDLVGTHATRIAGSMVTISNGATAFFNFLALMASAVIISPLAALSITVAATALFVALRPLTRYARRHAVSESELSVAYATTVNESVAMAQEIRVFNVTPQAQGRIQGLSAGVAEFFFRGRFLKGLFTAAYESLAVGLVLGGLAIVYAIGARDIASLGALVLILVRALTYSQGVQSAYHVIDNLLPFIQRITTARDRWDTTADPTAGDQSITDIERLSFADVSFSYVPDRLALDAVSFEVSKGETIGVVGPSGAGKSTFVQLLLRLRDPGDGTFRINDLPTGSVSMADWRRQVAFVPQESRLFDDTVEANIRFFRADVTQEDLERAAKLAGIHDEVMSWPDGYETRVGPRGNAISGGQRQRVCLARALAGGPSVIVLDEPTSALDMKSEALVQAALKGLKGSLTLFIVAHRLSTLNICDRVMVFRDGHLEAFEQSELLLKSNAFFREAAELSQVR